MSLITGQARPCVVVLGGSFDPVHNGHIALGMYFSQLLRPDELRIVPAGSPWQKHGLHATPEHRVAMLRRAFSAHALPVVIDRQEIVRAAPTYTIDTLRALRAELGPESAIVFLIGSDQLQQLDTWKEWQHLFDYAHICVASRPGFALECPDMPIAVKGEFTRRAGTPELIRNTPQGLTYLAQDLAVNISASEIRTQLQEGSKPGSLIPAVVLDYIEQNHLYKS